MSKLSTAVLAGVLAISFSQLAAAQGGTATSPNNPAATPGVEKDQARDKDRVGTRSDKRSSAGSTSANRRSGNNPAATPNVQKDDSQRGYVNNAASGATTDRVSPNNPASAPDTSRKQEQR